MSVYATIDLDSLICKLSDDDLSDFMLETFHDGYLHSGGCGNDDGFAGGLQQQRGRE